MHDARPIADRLARRARVVAVSCAVLGLALTVVALGGWVFDVPIMYTLVPDRPAMVPSTAGCIAVVAVGVLAQLPRGAPSPTRRALVRLCGIAAALVSALVLVEYALGRSVGQLPSRPAAPTAIALLLLGLSLLLDRAPRLAPILSFVTAFIALWVLAGHLYGAGPGYRLAAHPVIGVALPTGLSLELLAIALLLGHPERSPVRVFFSASTGGLAARRLVVAAIGVPVSVAIVVELARLVGLNDVPQALALLTASSVPVGVWLVIAHARGIDRSEAVRAEMEERFRAAFQQASDFMFIANARGTCTQASDSALALFGRQIVGRSLGELVAEDERAFVETSLRVPTAESFCAEWWLRSADGELVPTEVHARMLSNESWLLAARDARDRKAAEANLERAGMAERRAREQLESIVVATDAVSDAVASLPSSDVPTVLRTIARYAQALTHARHATIDLVDGEVGAGGLPRPASGGVVAGGRTTLEVPIRYRGRLLGDLFLAEKTDATEFTEDDERLAALLAARVGTAIETARLYQLEAAGRSWLQDVLDQLPDGVVVTDPTGVVTSTNRAARAYAVTRGVDPSSMAIVFDMRTPDGARIPWAELPLARAITKHEVTRNQELLLRKDDGADVPVLASATPIWSRAGEVIGAVLVFQDVSTLKELERLREQWTSIIAHDIRQPLAVISLSAQSIARRVALDEAARRSTKVIIESCAKLERMARDLLDASRIEARNLTLERAPVDFAHLVHDVVDRAGAVTRGVPIRLELREPLPRVAVDAGRVEQVFFNLLSNAAKYGDRASPIRVRVGVDGDVVMVEVANRGPGIDPNEISRLFTRFARTSRSSLEGVGLGLYISKGLVEAHGGCLSVESAPGEQTTFRFTLPALPPSVEWEQPPAQRPSRSSVPA